VSEYTLEERLAAPLADPAAEAGYAEPPQRVGFFTDTSVCIGCKACEVACKVDPVRPARRAAREGRGAVGRPPEGGCRRPPYGHDPADGVGGDGAFFLLLDEPEVYGLPPDPVVTTRDLPAMWKRAALTAAGVVAAVAAAFVGVRR
jgi:formate dehydrogenase iron-sulfur subunit